MSRIFDKIWPSLVLIGVFAIPVVLLLLITAHDHVVSGKQVTFDRARSSLLAAFNDIEARNGSNNNWPKLYERFRINPYTNEIIIGGSNYQGAFITEPEYQFCDNGNLMITTDRIFIWLDYRRGAKIIGDTYKVSQWRTGY